MSSDESLWGARVDEAQTFGVLFDRHAKMVYNHCFRRVANWSRAEDLLSLTFLEGWRSRERLHFVNASALPWLLGVATNVSRNNIRSWVRYQKLIDRLPQSDAYNDEFERVDERLVAEKTMQRVLHGLEYLTDDELDVVSLCGWQAFDSETAAASLGIPVGTVKSRLARARTKLTNHERDPSDAHRDSKRRVTLRRLEES